MTNNLKQLHIRADFFSASEMGRDDLLIGGATSHGGLTTDSFSWGLDRVDEAAAVSFFNGRFLRGVDLARGADEPDPIVDIIVGTGVQGHVKAIDIDATASRLVVNDVDASTAGAVPSKMHLLGHTLADASTYRGTTSVVDGGVNMLFGDGSVRDVDMGAVNPLSPYGADFIGGVFVGDGDNGGGFDPYADAIVFAGDRYDVLPDQFIGGLSVAVGDVELPILMHAGFLF